MSAHPLHKILLSATAAILLASCGGGDSKSDGPTQAQGEMRRALAINSSVPAPVLSAQWTALPNPAGTSPDGPNGRDWTEMTWNPVLRQVVIFGGNGLGFRNDIWAYDETTTRWTSIDPQVECPGNTGFSKPNGTDDSNFKYDPVNGYYWLFGAGSGYRCIDAATVRTAGPGSSTTTIVDASLDPSNDTAYQGWSVRIGSSTYTVANYNAAAQTLTLTSAASALSAGSSYRLYATAGAGTWYFDPATSSWTGQNMPGSTTGLTPSGVRIAPAVDYSTADRAFVLFAGASMGSDVSVWRLDVLTKRWTNLPAPSTGTPPHMRELLNSFVYDKANDVFILFGGVCSSAVGCSDGTLSGDTWSYKLATNTWTRLTPDNSPAPRVKHLMAYDEANGVIVMHGGATSNGLTNDTWYYHYLSNTWTQVSPAYSPPVRQLGQIAYSSATQRTVIFGGEGSSANILSDLWALKLVPGSMTSTLLSPADGSSFTAPATITLTADGTTPLGTISRVQYFANGAPLGEATSAPFSISATGLLAGTYTLTAVVINDQGQKKVSQPATITVTGSYLSPAVTINTANWPSTFVDPSAIDLVANVNVGQAVVNKVEFYIDGAKVGETASAPYRFTWTSPPVGVYKVSVVATDANGVRTTSASNSVVVASSVAVNVAARTQGAVATASSSFSNDFPVSSIIDGVRTATNWGSGGGWNDATVSAFPDWVQINFNGAKSISRIDVVTLGDSFTSPGLPSATTTFSSYGVTDFDVQYWTGAGWANVPGGSIKGNNLVVRSITFNALTTDRIRVQVNAGQGNYSRLVEVEAWTAAAGTPANAAPAVALSSPTANSGFNAPANIALSALATDSDGTVAKVEFYAGTTKVGEATSAPFAIVWANVAAGTYSLSAVATDNAGATTTSAAVPITISAAGVDAMNVALAANGGSATASSSYGTNYAAPSVIDGVRHGRNWGNGGGWNDATGGSYPDWVQVNFNASKTINRVDVVTLSDSFTNDGAPGPTTTFSKYGVTAFDVQYWTGSAWATVPGGSITGNSLVARRVTFNTLTTDRIRVLVNSALAGYSRIVEVEAWTPGSVSNVAPTVSLSSPATNSNYAAPATITISADAADSDGSVAKVEFFAGATKLGESTAAPYGLVWSNVASGSYSLTAVATDSSGATTTSASVSVTVNSPAGSNQVNVALASNGGVASASSTYSGGYGVASVNDGVRDGRKWGNGGGWNDASSGSFPDWVQIIFNASKSISRIDVITLGDSFATDAAPGPTTTFSKYGLTSFDVQYWNGAAWVTVPNGSITSNNLVARTINFSAVTTDRIRVLSNSGLAGYSRVVEIEAWGN